MTTVRDVCATLSSLKQRLKAKGYEDAEVAVTIFENNKILGSVRPRGYLVSSLGASKYFHVGDDIDNYPSIEAALSAMVSYVDNVDPTPSSKAYDPWFDINQLTLIDDATRVA